MRNDGTHAAIAAFTLLELVAVIAILALTASIAVSSFRGESPVSKVNSAALQFENFCARSRFRVMETGTERIIAFRGEDRTFFLKDPKQDTASGVEPEDDTRYLRLEWKIPDDFSFEELETEAAEQPDGTLEVFRLFPDGGASGKRSFEFQYRSIRRVFRVSPLTGMIRHEELTGDGGPE